MAIEAELKRRLADGSLASWLLNDDGTDPVADAGARLLLQAVSDRLAQTLSVGGIVTVANPPASPEAGLAKEITLASVVTLLGDIFAAVDGLEVTAGNIEISSGTINLQTDEVEALLRTLRDSVYRRTDPLPAGTNAIGSVSVDRPTLTERMKAWARADGYRMWTDLADAAHVYLCEAPAGADPADPLQLTWRGIRISKAAGPVQEASGFNWTQRAGAAWA